VKQNGRSRAKSWCARTRTCRHSSAATTTTTAVRSKEEIRRLIQARVKERDSWTDERPTISGLLKFFWEQNVNFQPPTQEELDIKFPLQSLNWDLLRNPNKDKIQISWLGHASVLIQVNGWNILADPVFSQRCSPMQIAGPKRYQPPPCSLVEMVEKLSIDTVLITHNHYDHLDYTTVQYLADNTNASFVLPLGLREWFHRHVSTSIVTYEQDWHESCQLEHLDNDISSLSVTAVPMRHWTNRTGDRDKTLWCGFALRSKSLNILVPGDTAWFDGLETVGAQYGPFDVAALPIGAYEPRDFMKTNHINPEEAVRMKDAVQAKHAVPVHWGTFPLTCEPVMEPREWLIKLMKDREDQETFQPWLIGETKVISADGGHC
jgi:N-acyl-phosphatidylethanolamine-hydrolysing phospholipase D